MLVCCRLLCILALITASALAQAAEESTSAITAPPELFARALKGDADAMVELGHYYEQGRDSTPDFGKAIHWYRQAIEKEQAMASFRLGQLLFKGQGQEADEQQAFTLTQTAARQEIAEAQYFLGWMYEQARGTHKDLPNAIRWYRRAKLQGHKKAAKAYRRVINAIKRRQ